MFALNVLQNGPWSISKANCLNMCPKQYNYKYITKTPEVSKSAESQFGVFLHQIIETILKNPKIEAETLIEESDLNIDQKIEAMKRAKSIMSFNERIDKFKELHGVKTTLVEHKLAIGSDFKKTDFFNKEGLLRGLIDYGMITKDRVLIIIDHKSGRKKPINEHNVQFNAYMILGAANFDIDAVQCAVNYIGSDKLEWANHRDGSTKPWTRAEIEQQTKRWLVTYLNSLEPQIEALSLGKIKHKVGWQCEWCSYSPICEEGQVEIEKRVAKRALAGNE